MSVGRIGAWRLIARAEASRTASGAMPAPGLSGLPGETSHHTSSRSSASIAARLIARCPECAGLNDPPSRPMRRFTVLRASSCARDRRSEEHTSELQSLMRISYAVFCLKKKKDYHAYLI